MWLLEESRAISLDTDAYTADTLKQMKTTQGDFELPIQSKCNRTVRKTNKW